MPEARCNKNRKDWSCWRSAAYMTGKTLSRDRKRKEEHWPQGQGREQQRQELGRKTHDRQKLSRQLHGQEQIQFQKQNPEP